MREEEKKNLNEAINKKQRVDVQIFNLAPKENSMSVGMMAPIEMKFYYVPIFPFLY